MRSADATSVATRLGTLGRMATEFRHFQQFLVATPTALLQGIDWCDQQFVGAGPPAVISDNPSKAARGTTAAIFDVSTEFAQALKPYLQPGCWVPCPVELDCFSAKNVVSDRFVNQNGHRFVSTTNFLTALAGRHRILLFCETTVPPLNRAAAWYYSSGRRDHSLLHIIASA